jgi:hypothetical protein
MTLRIFRSSTSKTFSSSQWEGKASDPWPHWSYVLSFYSVYWSACFNTVTYASYFRICVHTWLVMLSHVVMSVVQVFPSLWCWVWLVLSVESIGLSSVVMWGDHGEVWCCGLSKVWNGGEGCDLHGLWLLMLKSAKDRVLGVDTLGQ